MGVAWTTPISSPEPSAGNRHFSTSCPALSRLIAVSPRLYREPRTSWLYIGQSLSSAWPRATDVTRMAPRTRSEHARRADLIAMDSDHGGVKSPSNFADGSTRRRLVLLRAAEPPDDAVNRLAGELLEE